jgi:membrane protein required for colicin V production
MLWIDWLILAIIAYNLIGGLFNGLLRSLVNLAALIGAYLLTPVLKPVLITTVGLMFGLPELLAVPIGMSLTWMSIYVVISLIGAFMGRMVNGTPLKWVDRIGGAAFGLLLSAILILFPLAAVASIPLLREFPAVEQTLARSRCVPFLRPLVSLVQTTVGPAIVGYWLQQDQQRLQPKPTPSSSPQPRTPGHKSPKPGLKTPVPRAEVSPLTRA